ncbi:hypothetical protein KIW84_056741 [Lathyrus oleraceus]|uniref:Uncharacterized protein n=1 Tax=Pisum sativum TaxID=3888 RepID=A0A9D5ALJ6_PEA|nr:hypothetical protein KIW84_056741 [Pisum sativum]
MEGAWWLCKVAGVMKKRFMNGVWPMEITEDSTSATASEKGCVWKLEANAKAKFDETVEAHIKPGRNSKRTELVFEV